MNNTEFTQREHELVMKGYKFLGWENDFHTNPPEEKKKCEELGHQTGSDSNERCEHITACGICKIYYKTDSGD